MYFNTPIYQLTFNWYFCPILLIPSNIGNLSKYRFYSSSSNLGLLRLSEICTDLELESANTQVNKSELLDQLVEAFDRIVPELKKLKSP